MSQQDQRAKVSVRAIAALAFAAVVVVAADQVVKALVVANLPYGQVVPVLGGALQFLYVRNPGAAFSFAVNMTWVFSIVSAAVVVAIIVFARRIRSMWWAIVLGMLLGGALGNLSDRLFRAPGFGQGHVVDFISTPWMMPAIYNIADSFICVSMVVFVLLVVFGVNLDGTRTVSTKRKDGQEVRVGPATDARATLSVASTDVAESIPRSQGRSASPHSAGAVPPSGDAGLRGDQRDSLGHDAT